MKLTGNLKKTTDKTDTKEGKKEAIRKAGVLLSDNELEMVSGGGWQVLPDGSVDYIEDEQNDNNVNTSMGPVVGSNYMTPHR
jgi:hypothetical protein